MFFSKSNTKIRIQHIDEVEIPEIERLLFNLLSYKQFTERVRLYNLDIFRSIREGIHLDYEGNVDADFIESYNELKEDYKSLVEFEYKINSNHLPYFNQNNNLHFVHLNKGNIVDIINSISELKCSLYRYINTIGDIIKMEEFTRFEDVSLGEIMKKYSFLEMEIYSIQQYLRLIRRN